MQTAMNLASLLGRCLQDQVVQDFIASISEEPETRHWDFRTYYKFKRSGFSLSFTRR